MLNTFITYLSLILIIITLVMLAQKLKIAYPIVLVLGGLAISLIPGLPVVSINPEMIFMIFLPPLLYEAAWYTSWKNFWKWRRVITSFAFLIVIVTSFIVALVSSSIIPGFTMALGFLLGGIVSPPDAVSASAILKNVKVPKRLSSILEGESLLNDASSLIVFRFALVAVDTGRFVFHEAAFSFVIVIAMGILTGVLIGMVYYAVHKWLPTTTNMDIVLTFTAPYVMYIVAESFHFSGVLSVVSGGLFLSARSHLFLNHRSRYQGSTVWSTIGFVLNGLVFMLIGLELPVIVDQLGDVSLWEAIKYGLLISLVLIVMRMLCTIGASYFTVFISRYITTADSRPGIKLPVIFGWAGMRGVVSLAAALSIPLALKSGPPFPQRDLIIFITFIVILVTLVLQGLTLPLVIRWMNIPDRDAILTPEEQELMIRKKLAEHTLKFLEEEHNEVIESNKNLQQLRARFQHDEFYKAEHLVEPGHDDYRRVYLEVLEQQRVVLHELDKGMETDDEIIRKHLSLLDLEEEKLRLKFEVS